MSAIRSEQLEQLLQEAHFDRHHDEVKEIEETVVSLVFEVAHNIGKRDPLFKNFVFESGSFYEDLKTVGPDEFDYMICLRELSKPGICAARDIPRNVPDPGYVDLQILDTSVRRHWQTYMSRSQCLKPRKLLEMFKEYVKDALKKLKREYWGKLDPENFEVELRKIPVTVKLKWNGDKYKNYNIDIDFVLCIKMDGWPISSDIRDRVSRGHPGFDVFQEVIQAGHHLVASTIGEAGKARPCWRLSFSSAEGIMLKRIAKSPNLVHKAVVKILKVLRKRNEHKLCLLEQDPAVDQHGDRVSYATITWAFHSYVLKTMFMHEWCEFPEDSYWMEDRILERINGILRRIRESLSNRDIRSFWIPNYKLFNFRARGQTSTDVCEGEISSLMEWTMSLM